ncbi:DUF6173 family protein [Ligaoa zhengdingensis]|uniref:DUF6173 family protein n=1 Tax=Ligaoa zhengdingensis TaxID=2763658 RepID=UPI00201677F8|nr:DUF6173 family protein [Ligaoa zhengdingensis]
MELKDLRPTREYYLADYQYEIIMKQIQKFEQGLDGDHEVAFRLCHFGQSILLHVTDVGYCNPSIIVFRGFVDGKPAQLIQHVSELNFLLMSVERPDPKTPARRIGFAQPN